MTSWFNPEILRMETRLSKNSLDMTSAKNKSPPFFMQISVNYSKKKGGGEGSEICPDERTGGSLRSMTVAGHSGSCGSAGV